MNSKLNLMIFSVLNFLLALILLLIIPNPVPISISSRFIVGELGSKWILLCFLALGLLIPSATFLGKQKTEEQKAFAKRRQVYISILLTIWVEVIYFFISLFNNQKIIGSRVLISVMSLVLTFVACLLSLFSEYLDKLKTGKDFKRDFYIDLTIWVARITGYILLVIGGVNIFVDSIILFVAAIMVGLGTVSLVPLITIKIIENNTKKIALLNEKYEKESLEKLDSAVNFAGTCSEVKVDMSNGNIDDLNLEKVEQTPQSQETQNLKDKETKQKNQPAQKTEPNKSNTKKSSKKTSITNLHANKKPSAKTNKNSKANASNKGNKK